MTFNKLELTNKLEMRFKKDKAPSVALQVAINNENVYDYFYGARHLNWLIWHATRRRWWRDISHYEVFTLLNLL